MLKPQEDFAAMIAGLISLGLTQSAIAQGAGVSEATVSRMKAGDAKAPGYSTVVRIKSFDESVRLSHMKGFLR